jgi:hypothetical protein
VSRLWEQVSFVVFCPLSHWLSFERWLNSVHTHSRLPPGVEVFHEEDRKRGVFVGRQFYIHDPDDTVIEITEWDGISILD